MITLHFHLQPQYKYELFHINFTRRKVLQNLIEPKYIREQEKWDASVEQEGKKTELERTIEYRTKGEILPACKMPMAI